MTRPNGALPRGLRAMRKRVKHVHPLVASTALDIIMASYESLMSDNIDYELHKRGCAEVLGREATAKELEQLYLERNWGKGVGAARATLARMLAPGTSPGLDDAARMSIHEALVLDGSLAMGRKGRTQWGVN